MRFRNLFHRLGRLEAISSRAPPGPPGPHPPSWIHQTDQARLGQPSSASFHPPSPQMESRIEQTAHCSLLERRRWPKIRKDSIEWTPQGLWALLSMLRGWTCLSPSRACFRPQKAKTNLNCPLQDCLAEGHGRSDPG